VTAEPSAPEVTEADRERARAWWVRVNAFISTADDRKVERLAEEFAAVRRDAQGGPTGPTTAA
jgi:hypothetical protein